MIVRRFAAGVLLWTIALWPFARGETSWQLEQVESRLTQLSGVWGTSAENVFAVGSRGAILHFDGERWSRFKSGSGKHLAAVWAGPGTQAFAVGLDGTVLHFDGRGWEAEKSGTSKTLVSVWGASPSDVFAVGRGGTILHFDGRTWTRQPSGTKVDLLAVWGRGPAPSTAVYAAGDRGTLLHYDGTRWTQAVASFGWRWTLTALGGTSDSNVFAAGWRRPSGALGEEREGVVLRYDGTRWSEVPGGENQISTGLWAASPDEVYFVGPALNGLEQIRRFDGQVFQVVDTEGRLAPQAIWGAPSGEIFVVGTNGFVLTRRDR